MSQLKGVCVGAGYFAQFQYEAWNRIPNVEIVAACDKDADKIKAVSQKYDIPKTYADVVEMLDVHQPDFIDIITPPQTHFDIIKAAADRGVHIICQKPLAPDLKQAVEIAEYVNSKKVRMMVHENFRWQPWHQEIKKMIESGVIGDKLHSLTFRSRQGDGWGEDAYLDRQPYFRDMQRFLLHELGIHFIDTFRFLGGDIRSVYAVNRKLNPVIAGEDCCMLVFNFANDVVGIWDANRYNEFNTEDSRYTFGEFVVEGNGGTIRLYCDARLTIQKLGESETEHDYVHKHVNFSGDCVYFTQLHFVDCMLNDLAFATDVASYIENIEIEEAFYQSATNNKVVEI